MLDNATIQKLFEALNRALKARKVVGEIGLCGGAVMCVVFEARVSTKDVDGIFEPTSEIRKASREVAREMGVPQNWLKDVAKAYFLSDPPRVPVMDLSNLRIWAPRADYMLAMKCVSARFDTHDTDDVKFLVRHLGLKKPGDVFEIVEKYYPRKQVPSKTQILIEEIMQKS
ncbi:MAG: hypothetical protein V1929_06245 [bacterium]